MDAAVAALVERARAGELARLGVMGGTFDPVHMGHLVCAEEARGALGLDMVLFVPTGRPVFKLDRSVADGEIRLAMLAAAVAGNDHFAVSDLEVKRPGVTYAVDTLRELREAFPGGTELVFVTGADTALTLPRWREAASLSRLAAFGAATRPGYELDGSVLGELAALGFDVRPFEIPAVDVSSSAIRHRVSAGRTIRYLVPEAVRAIIEKNELYREEFDHDRLA